MEKPTRVRIGRQSITLRRQIVNSFDIRSYDSDTAHGKNGCSFHLISNPTSFPLQNSLDNQDICCAFFSPIYGHDSVLSNVSFLTYSAEMHVF